EDLMRLCKADITSKNREKVARYRNNFALVERKLKEIEEKDKIRNFQPPVTGNEIMEYYHLSPCEEIGIIKTRIKDAILDGDIENKREDAWNLMLKIGKELNLSETHSEEVL
ncbi:MAG: tRNA nucleotidyltransferase, partial [Bacteroidales bacterium]